MAGFGAFLTCGIQNSIVKEIQEADIALNTLKMELHTNLEGYLEG